MAEKLYPNILKSGREDGKLANSDNLWDKKQEFMQERLNEVLSDFFNFYSGNIKDKSVDLDSLAKELQDTIIAASSIPFFLLERQMEAFPGLQATVENLIARVAKLEQNTDVSVADKKGFFLVDDEDNIGACVIPDEEDGYLALGWDGAAAVTPTYADGRGTKVLVRDADFSQSGLGNLTTGRALQSFSVESQDTYFGTEFTLNVVPNPASYGGKFNWTVQEGIDAVSVVSTTDTSITCAILSNASNSKVSIECSSVEFPGMRSVVSSFHVTYNVPVTGVEISIAGGKGDSASNPVWGATFQASFTPYPIANTTFEWGVKVGSEYVKEGSYIAIDEEQWYQNPATFRIKGDSVNVFSEEIYVLIRKPNGTTMEATKRVYVRPAQFTAEALDVVPIDGVDSQGSVIDSQFRMLAKAIPENSDAGSLTWSVDSGPATVDEQGSFLLTPEAKKGDTIVVRATSDKEDASGNAIEGVAILETNTLAALESLKIEGASSRVVGTGVQLKAVPSPLLDSFKAVNWYVLTGANYASIDGTGYLHIMSNARNAFVVVRAISKAVPTVQEDIAFYVTYDDSANPVVSLKHCGIMYGDHVEFHAYGYYADGTHAELPQEKLLWEVLWDYSSVDDESDGRSYINGNGGGRHYAPRLGNVLSFRDGNKLDFTQNASLNQWAYIRCTYDPNGSPVSGEGVFFDWYHEFTYKSGKTAVPDGSLVFDDTKVTINSNDQAVISAPYANKVFSLRNMVKCTTANTVFDNKQLIFETIDNAYCTLTNGGALTVKKGVNGQAVTARYGYRHAGDGVTIDDLRHSGTNTEITLLLSRAEEDTGVTSLTIVCAKKYEGTVSGSIIDGGDLSVVDQNGSPRSALWSVVSGSEYCYIDPNGRNMRIFSTGDTWKEVKVRATSSVYPDVKIEDVTFNVKCP